MADSLKSTTALPYDNADFRQKLALAALKRRRQRLSWDQVGHQFQEVIATLLVSS